MKTRSCLGLNKHPLLAEELVFPIFLRNKEDKIFFDGVSVLCSGNLKA